MAAGDTSLQTICSPLLGVNMHHVRCRAHSRASQLQAFVCIDTVPAAKTYGFSPNGRLRGWKGQLFQGGTRVPLIVRWPGVVPAGQTSDALIGMEDLYPTLASMLSLDLPDNAAPDGIDQSDVLRDPATPSRRTFHVTTDNRQLLAIRRGDYRYHSDRLSDGSTNPRQARRLYNIREDVSESSDLIDAHPEIARELDQELEQFINAPR